MDKDRTQQRTRPPGQSGSSPVLRTSNITRQQEAEVAARKKRSALQTPVVWGLFGGLCLIGLVEAGAKFSFERARTRLEEAMKTNTPETPLMLDTALARVNRQAKKISPDGGETLIYEWQWPSLIKSYRIQVVASSKDRVVKNLLVGSVAGSRNRPATK